MLSASAGTGLEIAIVGMAGRFPGAASVDAFWERLRAGEEGIRRCSIEEAIAAGEDPAVARDPAYVRASAALEGVDLFDAQLFGIPPHEAALIDPQQRLFLECAWEGLEQAGYDPAQFDGSIGVFAGVGMPWYFIHNILARGALPDDLEAYTLIFGNNKDHLTTRVAYKLDLRGPAVTVQTACSSSLVAVHLACRSLLAGECDLAIAGGVSIQLPERPGYLHRAGGLMSPDGRCRTFDAAAEGTIFGSGVGVVLLRRLEDAALDGATVDAVVKGSAVNNDGARKVGYAAPSVEAQAAVIRAAQLVAEVDATSIGYIEAHGTGTVLGDPIEVAALRRSFLDGTGSDPSAPVPRTCGLGSVKSNIGHLDTAAGVAGLIKTALALKHELIPASLNFRRLNGRIELAGTPFFVCAEARPWPRSLEPRRAGVSSFGMGGTNVHVVLEEAPPAAPPSSADPLQLFTLSAATDGTLRSVAARLDAFLAGATAGELPDVAHTLRVGRRALPRRAAFAAANLADVRAKLQGLARGDVGSREASDARPVVWLFPGQGTQYPGMARGLYDTEPVFRAAFDSSAELFAARLGFDVRALVFAARPDPAALDETLAAQPAIFTVSHALATLLTTLGVRPAAAIGHSVGEFLAAVQAGVLELPDAVALVAERARLMQALAPGAMLAVPLAEPDVMALLGPELSLAAVNGPQACVVAGPLPAIASFELRLRARGIDVSRLATTRAFHSAMVDPMLPALAEFGSGVAHRAPCLPYVSNVTGTWVTAENVLDPAYWGRHARATVRFHDGLAAVLEREPQALFVEVGPGRRLASLARHHAGRDASPAFAALRHEYEIADDRAVLLELLGNLWCAGVDIDWRSLAAGQARRRVALPTYPFDRQRHWIDSERAVPSPAESRAAAASGRRAAPDAWQYEPRWYEEPPRPDTAETADWLVFAERSGLSEALAAALSARGTRVNVVWNPAEDFDAIARRCATAERLRIVYAWSLRSTTDFVVLTQLASAFARLSVRPPVELVIVTGGVHDLSGAERTIPEQAALMGLVSSLPQEIAGWRCRAIDLPGPNLAADACERYGRWLAGERIGDAGSDAIAYRGTRRWRRAFERVGPGDAAVRQLVDGGVYVIVGGFGGVGREISRLLAERHRATLVLVTRGSLPKRADWPTPADPAAAAALTAKLAHIRELESFGSTVVIVTADVESADELTARMRELGDRFGRLDGVFHAAGAKGRALAVDLAPDQIRVQIDDRIAGIRALARALEPVSFGFCCVVSSLASILGGPGLAAYAGGHAAAEAAVAGRRSEQWLAVACDNWITASGADLAAKLDQRHLGDLGDAMDAREGAAALMQAVCSSRTPLRIVSTRDLSARIAARQSPRSVVGGRHPRPVLSTPYAAPRTPLERTIVELLQDLLGLDHVGADDNFFELGGDSVIGIQLVGKLHKAGIKVRPQQLFEHPTVAELAAVATPAGALEIEDERGDMRLLPAQHRFFERRQTDSHVYNQVAVLETNRPLRRDWLEQAMRSVIERHDALRARFVADPQRGIIQRIVAIDAALPIVTIERLPVEDDVRAAIRRRLRATAEHFDLERGPLVALAVFDQMDEQRPSQPDEQRSFLALMIHHLLVDAVSWRIVLGELATAYEQLAAAQLVVLGPRPTSARRWSETLAAYAAGDAREQQARWRSIEAASARLPGPEAAAARHADRVGAAQTVRVMLAADETAPLLRHLRRDFDADGRAALLAAIARAFCAWAHTPRLVIDLEGHGRAEIAPPGIDASGTVGWLTATHPVAISNDGEPGMPQLVRQVREQLRTPADGGVGYAALRAAGATGNGAEPTAEVVLLYLGDVDAAAGTHCGWALRSDLSELCVSERAERPWPFEIAAMVRAGALHVDLTYGSGRCARATAEGLAQAIVSALRELLAAGGNGNLIPQFDAAEFGWDGATIEAIATAIAAEQPR